jgi:uncharacterized protein YegL
MNNDGKIQALNFAIEETAPHMRDLADQNPWADIYVRAITFSSSARWHIADPIKIESFRWRPVEASGSSALGSALTLVAKELTSPPMPNRALPPALVVISDGQPTDDFESGLAAIMNTPWGRKATRLAIAIGSDADLDTLQAFIGRPGIFPLKADTAHDIVRHIRWASTALISASSAPASGQRQDDAATFIPSPPPLDSTGDDDVW